MTAHIIDNLRCGGSLDACQTKVSGFESSILHTDPDPLRIIVQNCKYQGEEENLHSIRPNKYKKYRKVSSIVVTLTNQNTNTVSKHGEVQITIKILFQKRCQALEQRQFLLFFSIIFPLLQKLSKNTYTLRFHSLQISNPYYAIGDFRFARCLMLDSNPGTTALVLSAAKRTIIRGIFRREQFVMRKACFFGCLF